MNGARHKSVGSVRTIVPIHGGFQWKSYNYPPEESNLLAVAILTGRQITDPRLHLPGMLFIQGFQGNGVVFGENRAYEDMYNWGWIYRELAGMILGPCANKP